MTYVQIILKIFKVGLENTHFTETGCSMLMPGRVVLKSRVLNRDSWGMEGTVRMVDLRVHFCYHSRETHVTLS